MVVFGLGGITAIKTTEDLTHCDLPTADKLSYLQEPIRGASYHGKRLSLFLRSILNVNKDEREYVLRDFWLQNLDGQARAMRADYTAVKKIIIDKVVVK